MQFGLRIGASGGALIGMLLYGESNTGDEWCL